MSGPEAQAEEDLKAQYYLIEQYGETQGRQMWAYQNDIQKMSKDQIRPRLNEVQTRLLKSYRGKDGDMDAKTQYALRAEELWLVNRWNDLTTEEHWKKNPPLITDDVRHDVAMGVDLADLEERTGVIVHNPAAGPRFDMRNSWLAKQQAAKPTSAKKGDKFKKARRAQK